jgi:hypothetical protein
MLCVFSHGMPNEIVKLLILTSLLIMSNAGHVRESFVCKRDTPAVAEQANHNNLRLRTLVISTASPSPCSCGFWLCIIDLRLKVVSTQPGHTCGNKVHVAATGMIGCAASDYPWCIGMPHTLATGVCVLHVFKIFMHIVGLSSRCTCSRHPAKVAVLMQSNPAWYTVSVCGSGQGRQNLRLDCHTRKSFQRLLP